MYSTIAITNLSILLTLTFASGLINSNKFGCKLKWQPTGFGKIPNNAIRFNEDTSNSNKTEYVGRIKLSSREFKLGRISADKYLYLINEPKPAKGLSNKDSMKGIKTYQILVNPEDCNITWLEEIHNPIQLHRDIKYKHLLVGRVKFAGQFVPGLVNMNTKKILFTFDGELYEREMGYQILESSYNKVTLELKNFKFEMVDIKSIQENTSEIIVGQSLIEKGTQIDLVQNIGHFKTLTEVVTILPTVSKLKKEGKSFLNCHLETLIVNIDFWYPSETLVNKFTEESFETTSGVTTQRFRNISTVTELRTPVDKTRLQVTSVASVYKGSISFKAEGIFTSGTNGMSLNSMDELVSNCGIQITSTNKASKSIHVIVQGTLEGQFITGTKITAI